MEIDFFIGAQLRSVYNLKSVSHRKKHLFSSVHEFMGSCARSKSRVLNI
jgi:hypothetical protein